MHILTDFIEVATSFYSFHIKLLVMSKIWSTVLRYGAHDFFLDDNNFSRT